MGRIALLFLGGTVSDSDLKLVDQFDFICCADSGLDSALSLNLTPDAVIGDLDSISENGLNWIKNNQVDVVKHSIEKDFTDGELAVTFLENHHLGFEEIKILGLSGGRPDHVYGNYLLVIQKDKVKIKGFSDGFEVQILSEGKHWFSAKPGALISIFAHRRPAHVKLVGLKYNFAGILNPTTSKGISNIAWGSFSVETNSDILIFIQRVEQSTTTTSL